MEPVVYCVGLCGRESEHNFIGFAPDQYDTNMMQVSYKVYTTDTMISLFLPAIIQFGFDLRQREHGNHQKSTRL